MHVEQIINTWLDLINNFEEKVQKLIYHEKCLEYYICFCKIFYKFTWQFIFYENEYQVDCPVNL